MNNVNGSISILSQAARFRPVNLHRNQGTQPRRKTLRRFEAQRLFGMSNVRKEVICAKTKAILHPTKGTVYGRVEPDGRLNYFR